MKDNQKDEQVFDGEPFVLGPDEKNVWSLDLACCRCGLRHHVTIQRLQPSKFLALTFTQKKSHKRTKE